MIIVHCKNSYKLLNVDIENVQSLVNNPIKNLEHPLNFNPEIKCEGDEWFYIDIEEYKDKMINPYLKLFESTAQLNPLEGNFLKDVTLLINKLDNSNSLVFKKITKSKRIESKHFLKVSGIECRSDKLEVVDVSNSIEIDSNVDAYYDGYNRLYFKNYSRIHTIFNGIDAFYREATEEEVNNFKKTQCLDLNQYNKSIGKRNLRLISSINDNENIDLNDEEFINDMIMHSQSFETITLEIKDNRFVIKCENDLNQFLKLALGMFYINPLTSDKMVANAAQVVK